MMDRAAERAGRQAAGAVTSVESLHVSRGASGTGIATDANGVKDETVALAAPDALSEPRGSRASEGPAAAPARETRAGKPLISFEELTPFHVKQLEPAVRQGQRLFKGGISERVLADMVAGPAKALVKDGAPIAAAGLIDEGEGRARAWALITDALSLRVWPLVVIQMRAGIDAALHPETGFAQRVYAETVYDWPEGHKLLLHLGMSYEGMNRGAFPGGRHGVTYARVRADVPPLPTRCMAVARIVEKCLWQDTMNLPLHGVRDAV